MIKAAFDPAKSDVLNYPRVNSPAETHAIVKKLKLKKIERN